MITGSSVLHIPHYLRNTVCIISRNLSERIILVLDATFMLNLTFLSLLSPVHAWRKHPHRQTPTPPHFAADVWWKNYKQQNTWKQHSMHCSYITHITNNCSRTVFVNIFYKIQRKMIKIDKCAIRPRNGHSIGTLQLPLLTENRHSIIHIISIVGITMK